MARRKTYELPLGEGSFYQRKSDGLWVGSIVVGVTATGSRRRVTVSARDKDAAWDKLSAKRKELILSGPPVEGIRTGERLDTWILTWLRQRRTRARPNTYKAEESLLTHWVIPLLGHRPIRDLGPADMRYLTQQMMKPVHGVDEDGNPTLLPGVSSTSARYAQRVLQQLLKDALVEGYPVSARALAAPKPPAAVSDRRALTATEALAILKVIATRPDRSRWVAALLQGMRRGEILGLTWRCVNLEAGFIDVAWQLQCLPKNPDMPGAYLIPPDFEAVHLVHNFHFTRPKTSHGQRLIPIVPWMHAALTEWREVAPASPYDLVWPRGASPRSPAGYPERPERFLAEWKAIQKEAGVSKGVDRRGRPTYFVLHEARHTAATLLLNAHVDPKTIMAILGHSEVVTTQAYQHVDQHLALEALESAAAELDLAIEAAPDEEDELEPEDDLGIE